MYFFFFRQRRVKIKDCFVIEFFKTWQLQSEFYLFGLSMKEIILKLFHYIDQGSTKNSIAKVSYHTEKTTQIDLVFLYFQKLMRVSLHIPLEVVYVSL